MIDVAIPGSEHNGIPCSVKSARPYHRSAMRELLRTTDAVRLSWLVALLADAGIEVEIFDTHMSILEGSIGAIPRRLMVSDDDEAAARRVLKDAGEEMGS